MRRLILLALTSGLLSACAIGPDYQTRHPPLPTPGGWTPRRTSRRWTRWWTRFDDRCWTR